MNKMDSHFMKQLSFLLIALITSRAALAASELPDPFTCKDGHRVKSPDDWPARRVELQELLLANEYGHLPPPPKSSTGVMIVSHKSKTIEATHRQFKITCDPGADREKIAFVLELRIPPGDGPFPVILRGDGCWGMLNDDITKQIVSRGYILAEFNRCEFAPDNAERTVGLYISYPGGDFGALAAWAWGYHRCVDFLSTLAYVDKTKIAITGHSRGGKAALLAGALDERIALTAPNCSGCGGAGCFRAQGPQSERLEKITASFPFWFTPHLKDYAGREDQLPFDQHFLKALCAPRALLSTEALDDLHANPSGTFQTYRAARVVYQFLGHKENIAIRFRPGGHEHNAHDFATLLDFADQVFFHKDPHRDWDRDPFPDAQPAFSWQMP
jgi:hypothetical protein